MEKSGRGFFVRQDGLLTAFRKKKKKIAQGTPRPPELWGPLCPVIATPLAVRLPGGVLRRTVQRDAIFLPTNILKHYLLSRRVHLNTFITAYSKKLHVLSPPLPVPRMRCVFHENES